MRRKNLVHVVGPDGESYHPWSELQKSGALWAINASFWYPRGYAMLAYYPDEEYAECPGFKIVGDGKKPWEMPTDLVEINLAFKTFKEIYP